MGRVTDAYPAGEEWPALAGRDVLVAARALLGCLVSAGDSTVRVRYETDCGLWVPWNAWRST